MSDIKNVVAYEVDGLPVEAHIFTNTACDPHRSVVVEACAGSGKTWLLVGRMLRLLLAGAQPSELLAITFTRKAAQEMRERLMQLMQELAVAPDAHAQQLLLERGVAPAALQQNLAVARQLYEKILSSEQSLSIDTFHSWFAKLLQLAPLSSGVPHGYTLTEQNAELIAQAYSQFMQRMHYPSQKAVKEALLVLYDMVGDANTKSLLDAFMHKRAEWWASNVHAHDGEMMPLAWLRALCGDDAIVDARLSVWTDKVLQQQIMQMASILGQASPANQVTATAIETAITAGASLESFAQLWSAFFTQAGKPKAMKATKAIAAVLEKQGVSAGEADAYFKEAAEVITTALESLQGRSAEMLVMQLNTALFTAGDAYVRIFQEIKAKSRVFDFADLEWQAYRLLMNDESAAYLQSRLDTRYKHILLDEFQDTNPLQWSIVQSWLAAYGDDSARPTMFVVGDPKQSIYRFRRAEPRVFKAAQTMLAAQGAAVLRANQTRRNASAIVDVFNKGFAGENLFAPQTTLGLQGGAVWRLPLIQNSVIEEEEAVNAAQLRNPLLSAREEEEDARRLDEGRQVAKAILHARATAVVDGRAMQWKDVMMLVRKRTHLLAYETALREVGIPFVSDKRGGLLDALEISDLIALLTFLMTPHDARALGHVLKSPVFGAHDQDLIALAQRTEGQWWARVQASVGEGAASAAVVRAEQLLSQWLQDALHLPVHDLLDKILYEGQLPARYAQSVPALMRHQVLGNLETFISLSLDQDAGRYPSLSKFIDKLRTLQGKAESDAPNEASIDASIDAVRILTVHGAKGLEAPVVVLMDTNHSDGKVDHLGVLCDWPEEAQSPVHFSAFSRKSERGVARADMFALEDAFREQEDLNLLYVAITRAKQLCIVSGIADKRAKADEGKKEGSWYDRLMVEDAGLHFMDLSGVEEACVAEVASGTAFDLPLFSPVPLPPAKVTPAAFTNAAIEEGVALHALMERLTHRGQWPLVVPAPAQVMRWLGGDAAQATIICEQAGNIARNSALARFFDAGDYVSARNEMAIVVNGVTLRCDRVVVFEDAVWVVDYKRNFLPSEEVAYRAQLAQYRRALGEVFTHLPVHGALITADGNLLVIET